MKKPLFVAISENDWQGVRTALFTADGNENAGALLCGRSIGDTEDRFLVRRFLSVPEDLYLDRSKYHLEVSPHFYNLVVEECLRHNLTPVIIHSHPNHEEAHYSPSDDFGEKRLIPVLQSLLPEATPASLLVTPSSVTGRSYKDNRFLALDGLKIFGLKCHIVRFSKQSSVRLSPRYNRQVRAFGEPSQTLLQAIKLGVVGVGGIGSLVVEQLARAGIKDFVLIDNDVIEESNISRMYGTDRRSTGKRKVEVVAKHARDLGATDVRAVLDSAIRQEVLLSLRGRDLVFSCVDNDRTRALLNRFSYQYLIPLIELGTRLDGRTGEIRAAAGRVVIAGVGLACLRCSYHLNPERIRAESLPKEERLALEREGYVMGIDEPVPAVISLNTVIAGLGVTAALNMFVNLTGAPQPVSQLYDATFGSVFTARDLHEGGCDVCDEDAGVKAIGDSQIVSAYD